jgi:uncharacterized protein
MRGAGGTSGGIGTFFLGIVMFVGGVYLLLSSIVVRSHFGFGSRIFGSQVFVTSGMMLFPFMIGVGMIFYKGKSIFGWLLSGGSILCIVIGVIANLKIGWKTMTLIDAIIIFVLFAGGLGILLRSLKAAK